MISHIPIATDPLLQYLIEGDIIGFILACYTTTIGSTFYGLFIMTVAGLIYIRYKSLFMVSLLWLTIGGAFIMLTGMFAFLPVAFTILGIAGVMYEIFMTWRH